MLSPLPHTCTGNETNKSGSRSSAGYDFSGRTRQREDDRSRSPTTRTSLDALDLQKARDTTRIEEAQGRADSARASTEADIKEALVFAVSGAPTSPPPPPPPGEPSAPAVHT